MTSLMLLSFSIVFISQKLSSLLRSPTLAFFFSAATLFIFLLVLLLTSSSSSQSFSLADSSAASSSSVFCSTPPTLSCFFGLYFRSYTYPATLPSIVQCFMCTQLSSRKNTPTPVLSFSVFLSSRSLDFLVARIA